MQYKNLYSICIVAFTCIFFIRCDDPVVTPTQQDNFDRQAMLQFWADDIIIPSYQNYQANLNDLLAAKNNFIKEPNESHLSKLKTNWLNAYKAWQHVAMFDIGKAETIGYRKFVNIYPTDVALIEANINNSNYNLALPSNFDAQGFPALDYLLFGLGDSPVAQLEALSQPNYLGYLSNLIDRLNELNQEILQDWKQGFRDAFINNKGSSATASTDKMVNDFLFYYEKYFRAGKIGIPAGVFSGNTISTAVEAPYAGIYSKTLFMEALTAVEHFFEGKSFDTNSVGLSLKQYLNHVQKANKSDNIIADIEGHWALTKSKVKHLSDNFKEQVETDHIKMLAAYDELQKAVILLKVDMMHALNIQVDYVDADGD